MPPKSAAQQQVDLLTKLLTLNEILLPAILDELTEQTYELQKQTALLKQIADGLAPVIQPLTGFTISQETPMLSISPGNSPVFTATPVPSTSVPSTPPTWTSSDTTNAPITVDATGLVATVAIPTTAVVGTSFTLTISYTNADGTVATGSTTQTIVPAPSPDITSFTIAQTT